MPVPPVTTAPYDIVNTVMNTARVRMNDAIASLGGDILTNTQPFTQQMYNTAWRKCQEFLANLGYSAMIDEYVLYGVPIAADPDPASQCWVDWTGFFDGTQVWTGWQLPQQFDFLLTLWDRVTGINAGWGERIPERMDGLPATYKFQRNPCFEVRSNKIYFAGTTQPVDMRFRYGKYYPDAVTQGDTQWYQQPVPIMRVLDCLADFICAEASVGRDDLSADSFLQRAKEDAKLVFNKDVRRKNRTNVRRRPRSGPRSVNEGYSGFNL